MNLYVRYFDHESLVYNIDDVATFLSTIHDIKVNNDMLSRVAEFWQSDNVYPFRLKVSNSNYILFLKTDAKDMAEFKYLEKLNRERRNEGRMTLADRKRSQLESLKQANPGWYEAKITFKRVVMNPETGKCQYVDTNFRARLKAESAMHCYERIVDHLQNRQDIDPRSQFPSAKSSSFIYTYLGTGTTPAAPAAEENPVAAQATTEAADVAEEVFAR